eukprot:3747319-Prymnesium_polylepis.1
MQIAVVRSEGNHVPDHRPWQCCNRCDASLDARGLYLQQGKVAGRRCTGARSLEGGGTACRACAMRHGTLTGILIRAMLFSHVGGMVVQRITGLNESELTHMSSAGGTHLIITG